METPFSFFKNRHKGKRIWVCSSGPSLLDVDESQLTDDDIIIACNSAIRHFKRADYFIWVDGLVRYTKWWIEAVRANQESINLNELVTGPEKCFDVFHQSHEWGDWSISDSGHFPGNIPQRAVSFAWMMGARQIILAGCDCAGGHAYHSSSDVLSHHDQFGGDDWREDVMLWGKMKKHNLDLPIVTISQHTPLRSFPVVKFADLVR